MATPASPSTSTRGPLTRTHASRRRAVTGDPQLLEVECRPARGRRGAPAGGVDAAAVGGLAHDTRRRVRRSTARPPPQPRHGRAPAARSRVGSRPTSLADRLDRGLPERGRTPPDVPRWTHRPPASRRARRLLGPHRGRRRRPPRGGAPRRGSPPPAPRRLGSSGRASSSAAARRVSASVARGVEEGAAQRCEGLLLEPGRRSRHAGITTVSGPRGAARSPRRGPGGGSRGEDDDGHVLGERRPRRPGPPPRCGPGGPGRRRGRSRRPRTASPMAATRLMPCR